MTTPVNEVTVHVAQDDAFRFLATFEGRAFPALALDEPPPLGRDEGPNASRILAVAIGNCLAASLVFCLRRRGVAVAHGVTADVTAEIVRNDDKRLRVGGVRVAIRVPPGIPPDVLAACRETFEDFCTVTASIRRGIDVQVDVTDAALSTSVAGASDEVTETPRS